MTPTPEDIRRADLERDRLLRQNRPVEPATSLPVFQGNPFCWPECGHPTLPAKQEDCYVCLKLQVKRLSDERDRAFGQNASMNNQINDMHHQVHELKATLEWVKRHHASSSPFGHAGCGFCEKLASVEKPKDNAAGGVARPGSCVEPEPPVAVKRKCPSTYTHSNRGKLECEKDEAHLHRIGDVEHTRDGVKWMSV